MLLEVICTARAAAAKVRQANPRTGMKPGYNGWLTV
jgi:hypothetical protein